MISIQTSFLYKWLE